MRPGGGFPVIPVKGELRCACGDCCGGIDACDVGGSRGGPVGVPLLIFMRSWCKLRDCGCCAGDGVRTVLGCNGCGGIWGVGGGGPPLGS